MKLSVPQRASAIATFRFIEVRLMELVAFWTPSTPEMEVKVMFGRHIWDFAQHADQLGKRTFELRLPEQHSRRAAEPYVELLEKTAAVTGTAARLSALYDALLPGLERRYAAYIGSTDPILDEPSIVTLDRIVLDLQRQRQECDALRRASGWAAGDVAAFIADDRAIDSVVAEAQP
jgi:hypothetical protein